MGSFEDIKDGKPVPIDVTKRPKVFDHENLHLSFSNLKQVNGVIMTKFKYIVTGEKGDLAELLYLGSGEWRIIIDNFPGQRKFYSYNFPIKSNYQFRSDMRRIGVELKIVGSKVNTRLGFTSKKIEFLKSKEGEIDLIIYYSYDHTSALSKPLLEEARRELGYSDTYNDVDLFRSLIKTYKYKVIQ